MFGFEISFPNIIPANLILDKCIQLYHTCSYCYRKEDIIEVYDKNKILLATLNLNDLFIHN